MSGYAQNLFGADKLKDSRLELVYADHKKALAMLKYAMEQLSEYDGKNPTNVYNALAAHFKNSTSVVFAKWIRYNLTYLSYMAPKADYKIPTSSLWACTTPNTLATTFWCVPGVDINICARYFEQDQWERSSTLIHEWVHKYGCNLDLGYEHEKAYKKNSTFEQLMNADSFGNCVRDICKNGNFTF